MPETAAGYLHRPTQGRHARCAWMAAATGSCSVSKRGRQPLRDLEQRVRAAKEAPPPLPPQIIYRKMVFRQIHIVTHFGMHPPPVGI